MTHSAIRACLLALAMATISAAALADPSDCATGTTGAAARNGVDACAASRYRQSGLQLEHSYQALVAKVGEPGRTRLKEAQRRWVAWRDAQCAFEASGAAGDGTAPLVASQCLDALTRAQIRRLDAHLHCPAGEPGCID